MPLKRNALDVRMEQAVQSVRQAVGEIVVREALEPNALYREFIARLAAEFAGSTARMTRARSRGDNPCPN